MPKCAIIARRAARVALPAVATLTLTLGLVACTPTGDTNEQPSSPQAYVEPGWMADQRQQSEEIAEGIEQCLQDQGWDFERKPDNSFVQHSDTEQSKAEQIASSEVFVNCLHQVRGVQDEHYSAEHYRKLYKRALDTRDCLENAGYTIDDPPSEDAWVTAAQNQDPDLWAPFESIMKQYSSGQIKLSRDEYYELYNQCPQAGRAVKF